MLLVTEDAHCELRLGSSGELEGTGETFVSLGIVVLQGDLQLDGLNEVSLLTLDLFLVDLNVLTLGIGENLHRR
jgi:hypothetical protein